MECEMNKECNVKCKMGEVWNKTFQSVKHVACCVTHTNYHIISNAQEELVLPSSSSVLCYTVNIVWHL